MEEENIWRKIVKGTLELVLGPDLDKVSLQEITLKTQNAPNLTGCVYVPL